MRRSCLTSLLIAACLLIGQPGRAQRAAVAPLAPRVAVVPPVPDIRVMLAQANPNITQAVAPPFWNHLPRKPIQEPLYVLNAEVIINGLLTDINPNDIETLVVYKGADAPWRWRGLATHGIIAITLKKKSSIKIKSLTLDEIGRRLLLANPVSYSLNGMPVAESGLRIATAAIGDIKITRATLTAPVTLVEIQTTLTQPEMLPPAPPGTIRIRGVASY